MIGSLRITTQITIFSSIYEYIFSFKTVYWHVTEEALVDGSADFTLGYVGHAVSTTIVTVMEVTKRIVPTGSLGESRSLFGGAGRPARRG